MSVFIPDADHEAMRAAAEKRAADIRWVWEAAAKRGIVLDPPWVKPTAVPDPVNRPAHYTAGSIEVIEFIEQVTKDYPPEVAYHIGNVLKYLARAPHKGNLRQDLEKGENYLRRAINRMVYVERAAKQAAE